MKITQKLSSLFQKVFKSNYLSLLFFSFIILILYSQVLNAEFIADDITAIKDQGSFLKTSEYLWLNPLFILRSFLFYISNTFGGLTPFFFRIWNIFFHIGATFLIFKITQYFTKHKYLPVIVAIIFAIHPIGVESVTWISGGIYAESTFFLLLSFLFFLKIQGKYKQSFFIWSVIFFLAALSTSEKVIIYPLILFLYLFLFNNISKHWKLLVPFVSLSIIWTVILVTRIPERVNYLQTLYGTGNNYYFYNPLFQWPTAIGSYLELFIFPVRLTLFHSDFYTNTFEHFVLWLLFIGFITSIVFSYRNNKTIFFWLMFFLISLLPTMNPFNLSSLVAERYVYLGSIGIYFIFVYFILNFIKKTNYQIMIFIIIFLLLGLRTIYRNEDWKNNHNFWIATVKMSPSDAKAHNSLGGLYVEEKNYKNAIDEFTKSITLSPNFYAPYFNLGITYELINDKNSALTYYLLSIERNRNDWRSYHKAAIIYFSNGDLVNAEKYIKGGIVANPTNAVLYTNLGVIYKVEGKKALAQEAFLKALSLEPGNEVILNEIKNLK